MFADFPEVNRGCDVDGGFLDVPAARYRRLRLFRHDFHQVYVADVNSKGARGAEHEENEDH